MAIKTSKSNEAYQARYKQGNLYAVHRKARLARLIKEQPNNLQLPLALKMVTNYRRKSPKVPTWSHSAIATAKLFKLFVGKFDKAFFSQKIEDVETARRVRNDSLFPVSKVGNRFAKRPQEFSIGARAHDGKGNLVWA